MTDEQAIETLKNYPCVCKYGTSPINCADTECDFGKAIRTLTVNVAPMVEERPKGEWIECNPLVEEKYMLDGNEYFQCSECHCCCRKKHNFCPNCGSDNRGDMNGM